jgi:cytochrome P450
MLDVKAHVEETLKVHLDVSLFETNEPGIPPEVAERPHEFLQGLKDKYGEVVRIDDGVLDGIDFAGTALGHYDRSKPAFLVLGYDAVMACMNDFATFRQGHNGEPVFGDVPMFSDPPEQSPYKNIAMRGLGRAAVEKLTREVIRPSAEMLADRLVAKGGGDLITEYAGLIPVIAISGLFGLPSQGSRDLIRQGRDTLRMGYNRNAAFIALGEMRYTYTNLLYERRKAPGDDFISWLTTQTLPSGQPLRTSEIVGLCMLLVGAGAETTGTVLGEMLVGLLSDRRQWEALVADRSLIPNAVQEALRWEGPVPLIPRQAKKDTEFYGFQVPESAKMFCAIGQANRDESRWSSPHELDVTREAAPSVAFGAGAHVCAGHVLARAELATALETLLDRAPDLRLDPAFPAPRIKGFSTRSVGAVHCLTRAPTQAASGLKDDRVAERT